MNNWVKMTNDEMEVGIEIATLKKGELQIKYAKDIVAKNKEIERLNGIIEIKTNRIQDLMKRLSKRQDRIDKAIEYIEKCKEDNWNIDLNDLLEILIGSDKE